MKNKQKIASILTAFAVMMPTLVSAETMITFSGTVNIRETGGRVSVMTLKDGADRISPSFDDIGYINQASVDENGHFSISVPMDQIVDGYGLYSNVSLENKIYVSEALGSDSGDGDSGTPFKTLARALSVARNNTIIYLQDMVTVPKNAVYQCESKNIVVSGINEEMGAVAGGLNLQETVSVQFRMSAKLENMKISSLETASISESANKIFACGRDFVFGEGLEMTNPIDVFGGYPINNVCESTNIKIYSGDYRRIYGGGENSVVNGDTHISVFSMNEGFSANDSKSNYYDSRIFGGGRNAGADVGGNTNITFDGGVCAYIVGGGISSNVTGKTNITISGGRVMNIYGGTVDGNIVHNNDSAITIAGGMVESVFGGSKDCDFNGNTYIEAYSGEVLRRIYGGCYNDWGFSWGGSAKVNGTTCVLIGKDLKALTGGDLSSANRDNSGIFAGSRAQDNSVGETSMLIFADGSYSDFIGMVGDQSGYANVFKSHHDYIVKSGEGGKVLSDGLNNIKIIPDSGKKILVDNSVTLLKEHSLNKDLTEITFENGITLDNAQASFESDYLNVDAEITVGDENAVTDTDTIFGAIYGFDKRMRKAFLSKIDKSRNYSFELEGVTPEETVEIRLFIWNMKNVMPQTATFLLEVQ